MGKNYSLVLIKPETPCGETDVLKAFGIQNPVLNQAPQGRPFRLSPGEVAVAQSGDCWLIQAPSLHGEETIAVEPGRLEQQLSAAFPRGTVLLLGNFETAAVFWYLLLENGQRRRLKANVREENLDFGAALPAETAFYKSVRTLEEGIEVYDWWTDKAAGKTTEYLTAQVGGHLGEAVLEQVSGPVDFSALEYRAYLDAADIEALRHQNWKAVQGPRVEQVLYRRVPRPDFDRWLAEKAVPMFQSEGFTYLPENGNFSIPLPLCQLYVTLRNDLDPNGAGSMVKTQLIFGNSMHSETMDRWLNERRLHPYDYPMHCGGLDRLNLPALDRVLRAESGPLSLSEMFDLFEGFLRDILVQAVRWCGEPKNLLCCLEEQYRLPFLSLQNMPEPAVHLFRAEFQRAKKQLNDFDFSRPFGNFMFFGERYACASDEEKQQMARYPFSFKNIDFQPGVCPGYSSALRALESFAAAYWAVFFPQTPLPPLDLPHRDVLRPAGRLPFNLSAEPPVVVGGDKSEPAEDPGTSRGFFQRFFSRFTGSKPRQDSPKEDFFRKAMQVRSNISLVLGLRKGRPVAGVREYVDKELGHFPEFRQPEHRFWVLTAYGKADPEMAFPMLEYNIFEELNLAQHGDDIRIGLDWLLSWNAEHFGFERSCQILEQATAVHLKNTRASHFYNLRDFLIRTADETARIQTAPATERLECGIFSLFLEFARSLDALTNNGYATDFLTFQNQFSAKVSALGSLLQLSPENAKALDMRLRDVLFEQFPRAAGLDPAQLKPEACRRAFELSEPDFATPIDFQIALARSARLRREMRSCTNDENFYPALAQAAAELAADLNGAFWR